MIGLEEPDGSTPLDGDDLEGLIPKHLGTRSDLNEAEFENLLASLPWARTLAERLDPTELLVPHRLFELHRRMFGDVWRWAGTQRRRETNIGVDPAHIAERVKVALDDAAYWHVQQTHPPDEIAVRLHHRLVAIHPFPNGNGRCTRLMADLYLRSFGEPELTWGGRALDRAGALRTSYLVALRAADQGDLEPLLAFVRAP